MKICRISLLVTFSFILITILPSITQAQFVFSCSDTDSGFKPYVAGECNAPFNSFSDSCFSDNFLIEARCSNRGYFCLLRPINCDARCKKDFGSNFIGICLNNICVCEEAICDDTDGGINPFEAGTCSIVSIKRDDRCISYRYLIEKYCRPNKVCGTKYINCNTKCYTTFGVPGTCSENACKCAITTTTTSTTSTTTTTMPPLPQPKIIISEIYYDTEGNEVEEEYVELYVQDDKGDKNIDITGWYITTFDGDKGVLPNILNLENFDYISIRIGSGTNDQDASNGKATVFLGRGSTILSNTGDEVGLYDNNDILQDFVRYEGGNGDPVLGGWSAADPGPTAKNDKESVQIHGSDLDSSINWISAPTSEGKPNIFDWIIDDLTNFIYHIHNGVSYPVNLTGGPWQEPPGFDIHNESGPFELAEIEVMTEYLNFTYNYLRNKSFGLPQTGPDGDVDVYVGRAAGAGGTGGNADWGNNISVDILNFTTFDNNVTNKATLEHEHVHLFQYNESGGWGPFSDWGDIEGQAEYWSTEITMAEFNISYAEYLDIYRRMYNTGPEGWLQDTDLDHNPFTDFEQEWEHYWANHLLYRCIAELYGQQKVIHIHKVRNVSTGITGIRAIEKAFEEEGINITFADILRKCMSHNYRKYKDLVNHTTDDIFRGRTIAHSETLNPWGTDFERVTNATEGFDLDFKGHENKTYWITLLKTLPNGTIVEEYFKVNGSTIIRIDPGYVNVTIIKTQINSNIKTSYTTTIKPIAPTKPKYIIDGISSIFNVSSDNKTATIKIHALSQGLNNSIYDFEIFFDQQQPLWSSAKIIKVPDGWAGQEFEGGLRIFTDKKPLETCNPVEIMIEFESSKVPWVLVIHTTNKTHDNIGDIGSQNPSALGKPVTQCPPETPPECPGDNKTATIETEIIGMDLVGINPIGPIRIRVTENTSSINSTNNVSLAPGEAILDLFGIMNDDPFNDFVIPAHGSLSCLLTDPFLPYGSIVIVNPSESPLIFTAGDSFFDVFLEISNPCITDGQMCKLPFCGNYIIEEGEECDPPGIIIEGPINGDMITEQIDLCHLVCDETCHITEVCEIDFVTS